MKTTKRNIYGIYKTPERKDITRISTPLIPIKDNSIILKVRSTLNKAINNVYAIFSLFPIVR